MSGGIGFNERTSDYFTVIRGYDRVYFTRSEIDRLAIEFKWKVKKSRVDFKLKTFRKMRK